MHELVKTVIEKYREKHKEVEEYLRNQEQTQISFSPEHIKMLVDSGQIPKEVGDWFLKDLEKTQKRCKEMKKIIEKNPQLSFDECRELFFKDRSLTPEETATFYEDAYLGAQLHMYLLQNQNLLVKYVPSSTDQGKMLFKNINTAEAFGIANCISNSLYHLEELLKNMWITKLHENMYEAKSSIKNTKGEAISLNYSFQASTQEEAENILKEYKSIMKTKGLKVLFAYWVMANKKSRVEYACPMIEIMKEISEEDREAFFSVKEKEEHWALTKMLGMSKLSRERKIKKRGTSTDVVQWVEQPLVEIIGGEKEMTAEDKYPTVIAVRVLMPRMDKKGFAPSTYKNTTLLLRPSDTFLAFKLQTRATQMDRGNQNLHVDWDFIFEAGNLQTTANTKKAVAKAQARKKMDRLQESEIIEKWDEELMGVCVTPKKSTKKSNPETKKNST